ncbi:MAG: hypothetical protein OEW75_06035, partial [Cyclobacteriaceae bacterium]|nr:hypothetical protein [Cyclobacteriaceae bacterium]
LLLFALVSAKSLNAQNIVKYTYYNDDKSKLKEEFQVKDSISNILHGKYTSYFISGVKESTGQFINNEPTGNWSFYFESGKLKMKMRVVGHNSGFWQYFYETGTVSMEGEIINNSREGKWKFYFESGELKAEGDFVDSKMQGAWNFFYEDGKKRGYVVYEANKGKYSEYFPSGELKAEGFKTGMNNTGYWNYYYKEGQEQQKLIKQAEGVYNNGKRTGIWIFYYLNGKPSAEGSFDNEKPYGEWKYYHENGVLVLKGVYKNGIKNGIWDGFYPTGEVMGRGNYQNGSGNYIEYYKNKNVKLKGYIDKNRNEGKWEYFYPDGTKEGECVFDKGIGTYYGYYPDGSLQTKGTLENSKKIGTWELYEKNGELSGYYRPFYDNKNNDIPLDFHPPEKISTSSNNYSYKTKKFNYFSPKNNEFQSVIVGTNPLFLFVGRIPLAMEFYIQERLGHEFEFVAVRDPFFTRDQDIPLDQLYVRGYIISIRQKFYNVSNNPGLWYFGHELQFANLSHNANKQLPSFPPNTPVQISATEQNAYYHLIFGYRLMQSTYKPGITIDAFTGMGIGYRYFSVDDQYSESFLVLPKQRVPLSFRFGLNFGYSFGFGGLR